MKKLLFTFSFILFIGSLQALDFWQYPEMADRESFFAGAFAVTFSPSYDNYFEFRKPEIYADYLLGIGIPVSIGISARAFESGYFAIGFRPGYHINLGLEKYDLYLLYTFDLLFQGEYTYLEYGGRAGIRRLFGRFFCLHIETGHKFETVNIGVSIKLN
jgi:hypothetical protein